MLRRTLMSKQGKKGNMVINVVLSKNLLHK